MKTDWVFLPRLERFTDHAVLLLRATTGAFLIYQSHDNVFSRARMIEFETFLADHGFLYPVLMAPLSISVQFIGAILLILGLFTRWVGLLLAINFVVAVWMVHWPQNFTGWWPALILVFLGLFFATHGAGRLAFDNLARFSPGQKETAA